MRLRIAMLALVGAIGLGTAACSTTVVEVESADDGDVSGAEGAPHGNPGTLVPPTVPTTQARYLLDIEPLIAFMNACVGDPGAQLAGDGTDLVGPCHCAAARMQPNLTALDVQVFEDRLTGNLDFSADLAAALEGCRGAAGPPAWSESERRAYLIACTAGSDRLADLCVCSLARAQQVVPADRLADFLASNEVQPGLVDFINLCA